MLLLLLNSKRLFTLSVVINILLSTQERKKRENYKSWSFLPGWPACQPHNTVHYIQSPHLHNRGSVKFWQPVPVDVWIYGTKYIQVSKHQTNCGNRRGEPVNDVIEPVEKQASLSAVISDHEISSLTDSSDADILQAQITRTREERNLRTTTHYELKTSTRLQFWWSFKTSPAVCISATCESLIDRLRLAEHVSFLHVSS